MATSGPRHTFAAPSWGASADLAEAGALFAGLALAGFEIAFLLFEVFPGLLTSLGMVAASGGVVRAKGQQQS